MRIVGIILSINLMLLACIRKEKETYLPGKIVVTSIEKVCTVFENSDTIKQFKLRNDKEFWIDGLVFMNTRNEYLAIEGKLSEFKATTQCNLVRLDSTGEMLERLYESKAGEFVGRAYPSKTDKNILFAFKRSDSTSENPLHVINGKKSIALLKLEGGKLNNKIDNIIASSNFELHESPWVYDESRFIYSVSEEKKINFNDVNSDGIDEEIKTGIYLYDLRINKNSLLIEGASWGICSPVNLQIAYIKENAIWVLDLKKNTKTIIYKFSNKERARSIHWTPDGKFLYIAYFKYYSTFFL